MGITSLGTEPLKVLTTKSRLRVADVLLVHTKRSLIGWIIRAYTRSYWNHVALVYLVPEESNFPNTFIIESAGQGIVLHKIDEYLLHPNKYDIGIKRLSASWYNQGITNVGVDFAHKVKDYSLQTLDSKYGWNIIKVIAMIAVGRILVKMRFLPLLALLWLLFLSRNSYCRVMQILLFASSNLQRRIAFGLRKLLNIKGIERADRVLKLTQLSHRIEQPIPYQPTKKESPRMSFPSGLEVNRYICSGFVQWAYFQIMKFYQDSQNKEPSMEPSQVVFNPHLDIHNPQEEVLLFTTPGDLASSPNLSWLYIVKDGTVWHFSGAEQQGKAADILLKLILV